VVAEEYIVSILDVSEDSNHSATAPTEDLLDANTSMYEDSFDSENIGATTISVTDESSKWKESLVLGPFYQSDSGWVFSMNFGWVYYAEQDFEEAWFWIDQLGWVWTLKSTFPFIYLNQYHHWFYFSGEDEENKMLYNYLLKEWMPL